MSKMRMFKFWNEAGDEKENESMSLKKAIKSVQNDFKDKFIGVEYISKRGKKVIDSVKIPIGILTESITFLPFLLIYSTPINLSLKSF